MKASTIILGAALALAMLAILNLGSCLFRPVAHVAGQAVRTANASWSESIEEWKGRVRNRHLTLKEAA